MRSLPSVSGFAFALLLATESAGARERWLVNAEGTVAAPLDEAHRELYAAGSVGDLGVYRSLIPQALIGARVSAGGLLADDDVSGTVRGRGGLQLGAVSGALRLRPLASSLDARRGVGLWLEGAAGPGIVEGELRAVLSPGLGYVFDAGGVGIGPVARYLQVIEESTRFLGNDARIGSFGLELVFLDAARAAPREKWPGEGEYQPALEPPRPLEPAALVTPTPRRPTDRDRDGLTDASDECPDERETVNGVNDHDGCPDEKVEFIENRLVLGEGATFGYDSATLTNEGEHKLDEVVTIYKANGDAWRALRVEGHTDARGSDEYNEELSLRRAAAVAKYLVSGGIPESMVEVVAVGEKKPLMAGAHSDLEHRQNRRVELVVVRKKVTVSSSSGDP